MKRLRALGRWLVESGHHLMSHPLHLAGVGLALVLGAVAGIPAGEGGYHYVWRDPHFCNDCHVHDYADESYFRSVHAGLTTCHDCHRVPIMHYPRNLVLTPGMYGQDEELEHAPHVEEVICSACHTRDGHGELTGPMTADVLTRVVKVDASPLHRVHLDATSSDPGAGRGGGEAHPSGETHHGAETGEAHGEDPGGQDHGSDGAHGGDEDHGAHGGDEGPITCMDCHGGPSNRAHRFPANRESCLQCHEGISESSGRLSDLQCHECHFEGFVGSVEASEQGSP